MHSMASEYPPKLSVLTVTYNHERYIRQAIESALCQETSFPFEIVVGEDCSTDGTRGILLELQQAYPEKIRLLLREKNIGAQANHAATFAACRGDFVAMLEGDDYWTDSTKLQKQVDALESHPAWSMCFHVTRRVYEDGSREPELYPANWIREEATIDDLLAGNFMNTCSIVFRNRLFGPMPDWHLQILPGDWATSILNADHGPIGFVPGVMADYRIHPQGIWAKQSRAFQLKEILRFLSRVDHHFQGKYREQIDLYRIRLAEGLVSEIEWLQQQVSTLTADAMAKATPCRRNVTVTSAMRKFSTGIRNKVDSNPLPADSVEEIPNPTTPVREISRTAEMVLPGRRPRSAAIEMVRKCMRPIENAVRRGRKAVGLFDRVA